MKNGPFSSPPQDTDAQVTDAASPLGTRSRKPFGRLTNIMNTLELGRNKLLSGTKAITRSVSQILKLLDFSVFDAPDSRSLDPIDGESTDEDTGNDTTLNDDDLLCSPLYKSQERKQKLASASQIDVCRPPTSLQIRRTQSLLQDPQLTATYNGQEHLLLTKLKTFTVAHDLLPRIDEHEMYKIVSGQYNSEFDDYIVIDCRFPYEFDGGHIVNAINISSKTDLEMHFIKRRPLKPKKRLLIFHCEYSIFRGPTMAGHLRKADRIFNSDQYPKLIYPDIVILEGGYKRFFDKHKDWCVPQAYVEMKDIKHKRACEVEMSKVIQASKLTRARSYNHFQLHRTDHTRSSSFTALLSSSEQHLCSPGTSSSGGQLPRRKASKIQKRQEARKELRLQLSQPLASWYSTHSESSLPSEFQNGSFPCFDEQAFAPPSALFREHSKNSSVLLASIQSSALLVCSENYSSAFTSTESLASCSSPSAESSDYFDSNSSAFKSTSLATLSNPSNMYASPQNTDYLFPSQSSMSTKPKRLSLQRPAHRTPRHHMNLSSPTTSSPLTTTTPSSVFENWPSVGHNADTINDSPLNFSPHHKFNPNEQLTEFNQSILPHIPSYAEIDEEEEEPE